MATTPRLGLPIWAQGDASPDTKFGELASALDFLVAGVVEDKDLTSPPGGPSAGDTYIVAAGATGLWSGHDGELARWSGTAWEFYTAHTGFPVFVKDEGIPYRKVSGGWTKESAFSSVTDWKDSVRAATTAAGTLSTDFENGDTIDGVTLATGDRILIKDQATANENGIYTVNASGAPTRAADFDGDDEVTAGCAVVVEEGTDNADTIFVLETDDPISVGSTGLTFGAFSGGGSSDFKSLTDTPSSYSGEGGKFARVNSGETGLEFAEVAGGGGGGGAWELVETKTPSSATEVDLDLSNTDYAAFMIIGYLSPSDGSISLKARLTTDGFSNVESGASYYSFSGKGQFVGGLDDDLSSSGAAQVPLMNPSSAGDTGYDHFEMRLLSPLDSALKTRWRWWFDRSRGGTEGMWAGSGGAAAAAAHNGIRLFLDGSATLTGTVYVYGLKTTAGGGRAVNDETGTSYTLQLSDAGDLVRLTNASAITVTVPTNASAAFAIGTEIELMQGGAGTVSVAGDTGVTIRSRGSLTDLNGQYAHARLVYLGSDEWLLEGDLA